MCTTSGEIDKLAEALAKAQGEMTGAAKDALNPHFKSKYADLAAGWDACRGPLSKNGLAITQGVSGTERGVKVTTILMHSSGQWIRSELDIPAAQFNAQGLGSATTYGRRYSLFAIVGLAPEDDDGNAASGRGDEPERQQRPQKKRQEQTPPTNTKKQIQEYADSMTPDELEEFTRKKADYDARMLAATTLADLDKIAAELKGETDERIKVVCRTLYSTRKTVIQGQHLPAEERPPMPAEEQAL